MKMTSKERMLTALKRGAPDRLPVTTHHLMRYFLDTYMGGISEQKFFDYFGMDAITWVVPHRPDLAKGEFYDPLHSTPGFLESRRIASTEWRVETEDVPDPRYQTTRYRFVTPKGELTMTLQSNEHTAWLGEHLIKEKGDIDLIGEFVTAPKSDVEAVNRAAEAFGARGLVRGHICCFDVYGQPGTWQDACCLVGTQRLIMETFDDPGWVHELLKILHRRKKTFVQSLQGARYDLLELGGGDASTTVISPKIFENFVAPYDADLIATAHAAGQRIVYHTCGGMMPILETIAAMQPDAMETLTPKQMGGDVRLAEAKQRIGDKVCMIGSFDQFHYFTKCSEAETRAAVRRAFEAAGEGGGFILSPSDHFFDADPKLIAAFADEARRCVYN
ncbi:MAG: uroporphyrinogen decarboxylase family protein [Caldilinea sp.]